MRDRVSLIDAIGASHQQRHRWPLRHLHRGCRCAFPAPYALSVASLPAAHQAQREQAALCCDNNTHMQARVQALLCKSVMEASACARAVAGAPKCWMVSA